MSRTEEVPVIAVDGPAAVGKGSVAREVARRLDFNYLDSGRAYRAAAVLAAAAGPVAEQGPAEVLAALAPVLAAPGRMEELMAEPRLDAEEVAVGASLVSRMPPVRAALLACQRAFRRGRGLVADGRDMAATVFPDAALKVYLDAALAVRAGRFRQRAAAQGLPDAKIAAGLSQFEERSLRDERRRVAPVRPAAGAVVIATDELDQGQVTERVIELYRQTQP